jgi:hypothetical protein
LQSAVVSHVVLLSGYGDLVLVLLAAWALQPPVDSGWQWAFLASIMVSFVTRLPWMVVGLSYLMIIILAQALRRRVWQAPLLAMFTVTFLGTILMQIASFTALSLAGSLLPAGDVLGLITLPSTLLNLLFAIPAYAFMRDLSRWVYPEKELQAMSSASTPHPSRLETWRLTVVYGLVFVALSALLGRLVMLQVVGGVEWQDQAIENYTKSISLPAARGILYDRNGSVLARNVASYNVVITPANLPDDEADIQRIYRRLRGDRNPCGRTSDRGITQSGQVILCLCRGSKHRHDLVA